MESRKMEDTYRINKSRNMNILGEGVSDMNYETNWHSIEKVVDEDMLEEMEEEALGDYMMDL